MRFADCLPVMSKTFLQRVLSSIIKDPVPKDDDRMRTLISDYARELASSERIAQALDLTNMDRPNRILAEGILTSLLDRQETLCHEDDLFQHVREHEERILKHESWGH
jgi:hypothetical protein